MIPLARWLLALLIPADVRGALIPELDAEYVRVVRPSRSAVQAAAWYWRQVAGSVVPALAMRRRRRARWLPAALQDLRFAARLLQRKPGLAVAIVVTLGLAIGMNTAIFSIVDGVLLRPLPFAEPSALVRVWAANPRGIPRNGISPPDYFDWRDRAHGFASLAAFGAADLTLTGAGDPLRIAGVAATSNLAVTLGVAPIVGRWFDASETKGASQPVVVLGERIWRDRFAGAADICGRAVLLDGRPRVVIGVMPASFQFPSSYERLWLPLPDDWRAQPRNGHFLGAVGRLQDGVTLEEARDSLKAVARGLEAEYPDTNRGWSVTVTSLKSALVGDVQTPLLVLLAAVGSVLLIACANVTSLLIASGVERARELAIRVAVGASVSRLIRQQLVESLLLSMAGAAAGLALAFWSMRLILATPGLAVPMLDRVSIDGRVLLATLCMCIACAAITGILPAIGAARLARSASLHTGTRSTSAQLRMRQAIVFAQIAIATTLVCAGVLLVRSFDRLTAVPAGFNADRVLLADVSLPAAKYPRDARSVFYDRTLERIRALPGVAAAGAGGPLPLSGQDGLLRFGISIEGVAPAAGRSDRAYLRWATPGYFAAMGIGQQRGRVFTESDSRQSVPVVVIDDVLARQFFGGADPIGRRLQISIEQTTWRTVVGVVAAVRQTSLDRPAEPHVYVPESQLPTPALTLVVRGPGDPAALSGSVREVVRSLDGDLPLSNVRPLADLLAGSTASTRLTTVLLASFAGAALLLTLVGVYGVVSQVVAQSTREIGVRMALGASGADVVSLMVRRAVVVSGIGVFTGCAAAWAAAPALRSLLYGIAPRDPATLASVAILLTAAATLAAYVPARRVLRLDVLNALRID